MFLECGLQITEAAGFRASAGGVVLGVKKQQEPFTPIVFQSVTFAVTTFKIEAWSRFIN